MVNKEINIRILKEAAESYRRKSYNTTMIPPLDGPTDEYGGNIKNAFIAGAEWQKQQMLKDAVEGFVGVHLRDKRADVTVNSGYLPKEMGIKGDSKVKIIIVKED